MTPIETWKEYNLVRDETAYFIHTFHKRPRANIERETCPKIKRLESELSIEQLTNEIFNITDKISQPKSITFQSEKRD